MQRYIQQLVEEFRARATTRLNSFQANSSSAPGQPPLPPFLDDSLDEPGAPSDEEAFEQYKREIENYVAGPTPGISQPLAFYADIDLEALPAPDSLNDEEGRALFDALNRYLQTFGHVVDECAAPDCPGPLLYAYLVDYLHTVVSEPGPGPYMGTQHQDCGTHPPECPFGQYCSCAQGYSRADFVAAGGDDSQMGDERFSDGYVEPKPTLAKSLEYEGLVFNEVDEGEPEFFIPEDLNETLRDLPISHPSHVSADMEAIQSIVDHYIKTVGVRYFSELTNVAVLAEETGELARLAARMYGDQSFKREADSASAKTDWADEIADVLFVLTCLANQTGVSLTEAFARGMSKRYNRDGERHKANEKLRNGPNDAPF